MARRNTLSLSLIALVFCIVGATRAQAADAPVTRIDSDEGVSLNRGLQYLKDDGHSLTLDEARRGDWHETDGAPSFGFTSAAYWFRLRLHNPGDAAAERLLQVGYPLLDDVRVFVLAGDRQLQTFVTGDRLPFAERPVRHHDFVFPLALPPRTTVDVYLRVRTASSMQVPLRLWSPRGFAAGAARSQIFFGLFYGIVIVMALYNLLLFVGVRDRSYLFFALFVTGYCVIQGALDGVAYQYVWPGSPGFNSIAVPLSVGSASLAGVLFTRSFLELRSRLPAIDRIAVGFCVLNGLVIVAALFAPYRVATPAAALAALFSSVFLLFVGILSLRGGYRPARFFVLAWATFLLGSVLLVFGKFGLLPIALPTVHGPRIGAVLDMLFLSLALADRINIMKAETETAQQRALAVETKARQELEREVEKQTRELRENAERLRELDAQKTRFFQNVSHELRTPLTLVLTPLEELVVEGKLRDDPRLEAAMKNAGRLLRLVNQLLDFQKIQAGRRDFAVVDIELVEFLHSMEHYVRPTCEQRNVELRFNAPDQPVYIRAEADALEKIVFNYLSNALKFTPDGGVIGIHVEVAAKRARITVMDTGPGIARGDLPRLFHVFSQLDDHAGEGTGLGLALVKELAEAMAGQVGVDSEPGAGSEFWVEFPTVEPSHGELVVQASDDLGERVRAATGAHAIIMRPVTGDELEPEGDVDILVVDDLADMRELIQRVLGSAGYGVVGAENGADALELAELVRPRLILTDWMMPIMTGPELIAAVRDDDQLKGTPVVLLTAKDDESSRVAGTEAGADAFLGKPFHAGELLSVVRNLLQLKQREREVEQLNAELTVERDLLERMQARKQQLTRFIVHDLKNPLTVTTASLDLLLDDDDVPDDVRRVLQAAMYSTETATRMVMDLLDVERDRDAAFQPEVGPVAVSSVMSELDRRIGPWLESNEQSLDIDCPEVILRANRGLVERILLNLIENAAKYGPKPGTIQLTAVEEADSVVLRVADEGPGIPAADRQRVFEMYHRLEQHRDAEARSSRGVGLVFCRVATEAQDGEIWVEDADPHGCVFCVRLPRHTPAVARNGAAKRKHSRPSRRAE